MHNTLMIFSLVSVISASNVLAQSGSDRISRPRDSVPSQSTQSRMGDIAFTNQAGKVYTMGDLTSRLQELRTAVDEALPLLSAFNENYSNTASSHAGGLAGAISGILSGARRNNGSQDQAASSGQRSPALSNIVGVLQGLFRTNAPASGSASVNTNTVHDLLALEGELEPVASVLRNMNLNTTGGSSSQTSQEPARTSNNGNQVPTPTGRQ